MQLALENEKHEPNFLFKLLILIGLVLFFVACASPSVKKYSYDSTANPLLEIQKLETEMRQSEVEQMPVFAPKSYARAQRSLQAAMKLQERGASTEKVLRELSEARSYYEHAKNVQSNSIRALPQVADARQNALVAGAPSSHRADLRKVDARLIDVTEDFENQNPQVPVQKKADLQRQYLDLELAAIKTNRLMDARLLLESARKQGASKFAPKSFSRAQSSLLTAEMAINTDRHNQELIAAASGQALAEARRTLRVTDLVRKSGRPGSEDIALDLVTKDEQLQAMNEQSRNREAQMSSQLQSREEQLKAREAQLQAQLQSQQKEMNQELTEAQKKAEEAQKELEARRKVDEAFANAQKMFSTDEAQVYRQGNNLVLRMKGLNFQAGRAELPTTSFETLGKVNRIIDELRARKIIVEGHTDATGSKTVNQKISQQRADAVTAFLKQQSGGRTEPASLSGGALSDEDSKTDLQIDSIGYGDEYPIANNKNAKGRAQNRRVDIIIAPEIATH